MNRIRGAARLAGRVYRACRCAKCGRLSSLRVAWWGAFAHLAGNTKDTWLEFLAMEPSDRR